MTKYGLPKYICFDVRTTLCSKKVKFDVTLLPKAGKKRTSTKVNTICEGMKAVIEDRLNNGVWTKAEVDAYADTYDPKLEKAFTFDRACKIANVDKDYVLSGQYVKDRYGKSAKSSTTNATVTSKPTVTSNTTKNKKDKAKSLLEYFRLNPQWVLVANFPEIEIYSEPYQFTNEYGMTCWTYHIRRTDTKKELKPTTKSNSLYVKIGNIQKAVYKLAADTFIHNPYKERDSKIVATDVHHINGDHSDNRLENLMHVTKAEHAKYHTELRKNKPRVRLTMTDIVKIQTAKAFGASAYDIMSKYKFTMAQVKSGLKAKI